MAPLGGHLGGGLYPTPLRALSEDAAPPAHGASLLLESGSYLLLESGDTILLE